MHLKHKEYVACGQHWRGGKYFCEHKIKSVSKMKIFAAGNKIWQDLGQTQHFRIDFHVHSFKNFIAFFSFMTFHSNDDYDSV